MIGLGVLLVIVLLLVLRRRLRRRASVTDGLLVSRDDRTAFSARRPGRARQRSLL